MRDDELAARFGIAKQVADAVLYEGYVLYPYTATSDKNRNQVRFQWGVLAPRRCTVADPSERCVQRVELVVDPGVEPALAVRLRCLQLQHRGVQAADGDGGFTPCEKLSVGDKQWLEWDEAVEHDVDLGVTQLLPLANATREAPFHFSATEATEIITDDDGDVAGRIVRSAEQIDGVVRIITRWADGPGVLLKVTIEVENTTDWGDEGASRDAVNRRSLVAVHTMAAIDDGAFISLLDPPEGAAEAVAGCKSVGAFPVLVGKAGATDLVLASPITLYDYPAIAPESEGDFHDGCEIDEILALRVLTLTDYEKAEARETDPRARAIIDRCDNMQPAVWDRLHGIMRDVREIEADDNRIDRTVEEPVPWMDPVTDAQFDPWTDVVVIRDVEVAKGSRVRMNPTHRADVHDMFLAGLTGTVAGVFHDLDGGFHVAVTVDGDPATELFEFQGRFYYFHPDEIEPLSEAEAEAIGQVEAMAQAGRDVDATLPPPRPTSTRDSEPR